MNEKHKRQTSDRKPVMTMDEFALTPAGVKWEDILAQHRASGYALCVAIDPASNPWYKERKTTNG